MTYIVSQDGKQLITAEAVQRFAIAVKPDCLLIIASYGADESSKPVTIGRYAKDEEPQNVLLDLMYALSEGKNFVMPLSRIIAPEKEVHDARTRRKGGS